jgi:hypothetical protein
MKVWQASAVLVAACLGGCGQQPDQRGAGHHGRYVGIGVYASGQMWSRMVVASQPKDKAAATTSDDEHVIVVVDSDTGEIRQCGDMTGYCVGMNPWASSLLPTQRAPIGLTKHAAEINAEADAMTEKATAPSRH